MEDRIQFKLHIQALIEKENYGEISAQIFECSSTNNSHGLMQIWFVLKEKESNFSLTYEQMTELVFNSDDENVREACWIFDEYCNDVRMYDLCYALISENEWSLCHFEGGQPLRILGHDDKETSEEHIVYFISKINDYENLSDNKLRYYASLLALSKSPKFSELVFEAMNESLKNKIGMYMRGNGFRKNSPSKIFLKVLELNPHEESIPLAIEYLDQICNSKHNPSLIRTILFQLLEILAAIPTSESLKFLTEDPLWWSQYFSKDYRHISDRWEVFQLLNMSCVFEELSNVSIENLDDEIHLQPLLGETYEFLIDDFPLREIRGEDLDNLEVLEEAFLLKWSNEGSIYNFPTELFEIDDLCDLSSTINNAQKITEIRISNFNGIDFCDFRKLELDIFY